MLSGIILPLNEWTNLLSHYKAIPKSYRDKLEVFLGCSDYYHIHFKTTGIIFIHVPKAAGTSISHALYGENVGHYSAAFYKGISGREYEKYYTFAVVRNPWDRVVSAYNFVKQGGTDLVKPLPDEDFNLPVFRSFETFVKDWLNVVDLKQKDVVFHPQHWFVCDKQKNIIVDHIGKLEKLEDTYPILEQKLGRPLGIDVLNKSSRSSRYQSYFNDETRKIISEIYSVDIELFGYTF